MQANLDLPAVRRFTDDLNDRARRCDNGEGMICSNLDESIRYYAGLCDELRTYINEWAQAVFAGRVAFDRAVEDLFKERARQLRDRAAAIAAYGRGMDGLCFELHDLNRLHYHVADFYYLLENWVSPQPAVSPAPRVDVPETAQQQIRQRLESLSALPSDWRPTDPAQLAFFQKQRAK